MIKPLAVQLWSGATFLYLWIKSPVPLCSAVGVLLLSAADFPTGHASLALDCSSYIRVTFWAANSPAVA